MFYSTDLIVNETGKFVSELKRILENVDINKLQNLRFSDLTKIFFENTFLFYILGFVCIFLIWKVVRFPLKILKKVVINSITGYFILYVLMMFKIVVVPFTYLSYFLVGSFGIIGIIISYLIYM